MSFLKKTLEKTVDKEVFVDACPISISFSDDGASSLLIAGDNATGKSFVCRYLVQEARREDIYCLEVSMGDRNSKGYMHQVKNFSRYGDEDRESTGYLTINRIIKDVAKLKEIGKPFLLILDEPDLGLSDSYTYSLGAYLQRAYKELSEDGLCEGFVIVSHSREVFSGFLDGPVKEPSAVLTGESDGYFWSWLFEGNKRKTIEDLLLLPEKSKEKRRAISKFIKLK